MGYVITKIENQEIDINTAQLFGAYTEDVRFFNGLKIVKESFLYGSDPRILPDKTFYLSANIQYTVKGNTVIINSAGGQDLVNRLVIPVAEMDIDLDTFKQYVIDVNGSGSSLSVYGEYYNDADAAANGVPIGGLYSKPDDTGQGGLIAVRRV